MLTFFRRIRKGLLNESAVPKYLLYAIGEIALVVIGILIALQINNWNEWRKDRLKESVLLSQLHDEFTANKIQFQRVVTENRKTLDRAREIIALFPIDEKITDLTTLNSYVKFRAFGLFKMNTFNPSNATIETITIHSIDLITNDELKQKVVNWKSILEDYHEDESRIVSLSFDQIDPYLIGHGVYTENGLIDHRVDISFLSSPQFESTVRNIEGRLAAIYENKIGEDFPEVENIQRTIDDIIKLTSTFNN